MFKPLTGIRAVAAMWVVLGHLSPQLGDLFPFLRGIFPLLNSGYLGVDLFFVLSGFILAHNHLQEFRTVSLAPYGRFLWLRLARLYPVHIVCLFALLGGVIAGKYGGLHFNMPERLGAADFVRNIFLIHAWGLSTGTSWDGPAWSISAEWFAYLLFPFIAMVVVRMRSRALAIAGSVLMYAILLACFAHTGTTWTTLANDLALVRVGTQFTVGCLLYHVFSHSSRHAMRWEIVVWVSAIAMAVYALNFPPDRYASLYPAPLMAVVVLALACAGGPIAHWLGSRTMVFWGEVSYSLYMTHDLLRMMLNKVLNTQQFVDSSLAIRMAVFLVYAGSIAGLAVGMYFIVERPARRWMRGMIGSGKPVDEARLPHLQALHASMSPQVAIAANS